MAKDAINLKGNRELWIDFMSKVKKERKTAWSILEPMIKKYLKKVK
jgi:hypothetical protein